MQEIETVLVDPDLGAVAFTVERTTYRRVRGALIPTTQCISAYGCIHPGTPEMLELVPEEERKETYIAVYTSFGLCDGENQTGSVFRAADRIRYEGSWWRVVRVREWKAFNYVQALAVKLGEDDDS